MNGTPSLYVTRKFKFYFVETRAIQMRLTHPVNQSKEVKSVGADHSKQILNHDHILFSGGSRVSQNKL